MGEANIVTKHYLQDNEHFADICNFYLHDGQPVIKPEDLSDKDITELALPKGLEGAKAIEKFRDILRNCCVKTNGKHTYIIIGIENQSDVHYAMVIRNMRLNGAGTFIGVHQLCGK